MTLSVLRDFWKELFRMVYGDGTKYGTGFLWGTDSFATNAVVNTPTYVVESAAAATTYTKET
jgi:hypothetical protein